MCELDKVIKLVDALICRALSYPASSRLDLALRNIKEVSEAAHDVAHAGTKLYKFDKAPHGASADIVQYTGVATSLRHHTNLLLAETRVVRACISPNTTQSA